MTTFAFVFPGQGSQAIGMLNGFADHPVVQATIAEASAALDFDLGKLIMDGPKEALDLTTTYAPPGLVNIARGWITRAATAQGWPLARPCETAVMALPALARLTGMHCRGGHQVRLLIDGEDSFAAMLQAISAARELVIVQFFIIRDDALGQALPADIREREREFTGQSLRGMLGHLLVAEADAEPS